MDEALRAEMQALADEADGLGEEVEAALDEHAALSYGREVRRKVDDVTRRYREAAARIVDEKDRFAVDRSFGRRISDVQKMASRLPAEPAGKPAEKPADTSFFATRAGKSSRQPYSPGLKPGETLAQGAKVRVTDEVEAWCGRCAMVRTQTVAAVVGDLPAQVVCQTCGTRAKYREGPARAKKETSAQPVRAAATPARIEADARQKEKAELLKTLHNAENVRPFSPKERYRVGEIIEHPEHGRGKIENTLPRSMLVRFAGGLKPVKLG